MNKLQKELIFNFLTLLSAFSAVWFFGWAFLTFYDEVMYWETPWFIAFSLCILPLFLFVLCLISTAVCNLLANHPEIELPFRKFRIRKRKKGKENNDKLPSF